MNIKNIYYKALLYSAKATKGFGGIVKHAYHDRKLNKLLLTKPCKTKEEGQRVAKKVRTTFWHLHFVNKECLYTGKKKMVKLILF